MLTKTSQLTQYKALSAISNILFPAPKLDMNTVFMNRAKTLLTLALNIEMDLHNGDSSKVTLRGIRKWLNLDNLVDTLSNAFENSRITSETEELRKSFLLSIPGLTYIDGIFSVKYRGDAEQFFGYSAMYFARAFDVMAGIAEADHNEADSVETKHYLMSVLAAA